MMMTNRTPTDRLEDAQVSLDYVCDLMLTAEDMFNDIGGILAKLGRPDLFSEEINRGLRMLHLAEEKAKQAKAEIQHGIDAGFGKEAA